MKQTTDIETVLKFLIEGQAYTDIEAFLKAEDLTAEQAAEILEKAFDELENANDIPTEVRRGWCLEAMRDVYRRLIETGDYNGAIKAVKEIANLSGAYPAKSAQKPGKSPSLPKLNPNGDEKCTLLKLKKKSTQRK